MLQHSAAVQEGIVNWFIEWQIDPDFGYLVATTIPGFDDDELLQPRRMYERQGRGAEYERIVAQLLAERREYLAAFTNLDEQIVDPTSARAS